MPGDDPRTGGAAIKADATPPADGPRRRDAAATRESLLAAARSLIVQHGISGVSTRDIAAAAGANQALVYRYFGSKEALLVEAVQAEQPGPDELIADTPLAELAPALLRRAMPVDATTAEHASSLSTLVTGASDELIRTLARERIHAAFTTQLAQRLGGDDDAALRAELLAALITGIGSLRGQIGTRAMTAVDVDTLAEYVGRMAAPLLEPTRPAPRPGSPA